MRVRIDTRTTLASRRCFTITSNWADAIQWAMLHDKQHSLYYKICTIFKENFCSPIARHLISQVQPKKIVNRKSGKNPCTKETQRPMNRKLKNILEQGNRSLFKCFWILREKLISLNCKKILRLTSFLKKINPIRESWKIIFNSNPKNHSSFFVDY